MATDVQNSAVALNSEQATTLQAMIQFLDTEQSVFILKGYAGTGKTTLIRYLVDYLEHLPRPYYLLAPTGRAARILKERTKRRAYTIHRIIYTFDTLIESKRDPQGDPELWLFDFGIRNNQDDRDAIYIIDEASMVSDQKNESGWLNFGSGKLLTDLISYTRIGLSGIRRKLIFVGDPAQLPPVNMEFSPALSADYLQAHFQIKAVGEAQLTQIIRQEAGSGILQCATTLRERIATGYFPALEFAVDSPDIQFLNAATDCLESFLKKYTHQPDSAIIITYTNKLAYNYNRLVREQLYADSTQIRPGDRIIIVQNNYYNGVELLNGEFGTVLQAAPERETRVVRLRTQNGVQEVRLYFRPVALEFFDTDGNRFVVKTLILENLLDSPRAELKPEEIQALLVDFYNRYPEVRKNKAQLQLAQQHDGYLNALRVKYGYAITGHKAQGGEWPHVYVDFQYSGEKRCANYFRWAYTAITRAGEQLYWLNYEPIGLLFTHQDYSLPEQEETPVTTAALPVPAVKAWLEELDRQVETIITHCGWRLNSVESLAFRQRYYIEKNDLLTRFDVVYRKNCQITQIDTSKLPTEEQTLAAALSTLRDSQILQAEEQVITFPEDKPFLLEVYEEVRRKVTPAGIKIAAVEHFEYQERYTFRQNEQQAIFNIFYRKNGIVTKIQASRRADNGQLVKSIGELLGS